MERGEKNIVSKEQEKRGETIAVLLRSKDEKILNRRG